MNKKVFELMNDQINKEFYSAYLYLDMSNYYADQGLLGFQNWFKVQAQEEQDHAMLFSTFLQNNDQSVALKAIDKPDKTFDSLVAPLKISLAHEQYVTKLINNIYDEAVQDKDYRSMQFLDWFIKEQGEEEKTAEDLIKKFTLFGSDPKALYMLDQEAATRVYSAPSLVL